MRLLIVFRPRAGVIVEEREFTDDQRVQAVRARLDAERRYPGLEVVVLSGLSREEMRRTHRRYFVRETPCSE